jgi:large conductance mechanosensitive channel
MPIPSDSSLAKAAAHGALSFVEGFKKFALRGNMIDLAVGVIIGGAFGKIVDSLVKNVIMPLISYVTPQTKFTDWRLGRVAIGPFLNDILSFLIVALALYVFIVRFLGWLSRSKEKQPPPPLTPDQMLLTEIRDLLKSRA